MNKNLYLCLFFFLFLSACKTPRPQLKFLNYTYNFGHIKKDSVYLGQSIIKNTGDDTLKIIQISSDCSCTKVGISKKIILPNDTSLIKFSYRTFYKIGKQENFITVFANTDSTVHLLQINALVR